MFSSTTGLPQLAACCIDTKATALGRVHTGAVMLLLTAELLPRAAKGRRFSSSPSSRTRSSGNPLKKSLIIRRRVVVTVRHRLDGLHQGRMRSTSQRRYHEAKAVSSFPPFRILMATRQLYTQVSIREPGAEKSKVSLTEAGKARHPLGLGASRSHRRTTRIESLPHAPRGLQPG